MAAITKTYMLMQIVILVHAKIPKVKDDHMFFEMTSNNLLPPFMQDKVKDLHNHINDRREQKDPLKNF